MIFLKKNAIWNMISEKKRKKILACENKCLKWRKYNQVQARRYPLIISPKKGKNKNKIPVYELAVRVLIES